MPLLDCRKAVRVREAGSLTLADRYQCHSTTCNAKPLDNKALA
jgi:hypothetical protein